MRKSFQDVHFEVLPTWEEHQSRKERSSILHVSSAYHFGQDRFLLEMIKKAQNHKAT